MRSPHRSSVVTHLLTMVALAVVAGRSISSQERLQTSPTAGPSTLIEAVKRGDRRGAQLLLSRHGDVNARSADGTTALHWAAHQDDGAMVALLLEAHADANAVDRYGIPPLMLASENGNPAIVETLIAAGANPNLKTPWGETALMTAARTGRADAVNVLIKHGAEVNVSEAWRGQTALMWAAADNHTEATRLLIERGADVNARSYAGFTPLLLAVRNGSMATSEILLGSGANVNDVVAAPAPPTAKMGSGTTTSRPDATASRGASTPGTSALVLAIINAKYDVATMLLEHGADPNAPDERGSALHALAFMRRPGYRPQPIPRGDTFHLAVLLLERGANPNARIAWKEIPFDIEAGVVRNPTAIGIGRNYLSFIGATPFYLAARGSDAPLMRLLADHGADPKLGTVQNITPLMAAAGLGFWQGEHPGPNNGVTEGETLDAVRLAWELGGDVNAVTDFGDSPIEGESVALLRRYPLNVSQLGRGPLELGDMRWAGSSALHGAALRGEAAVVNFLIEKGARLDLRNKVGWSPLMLAEGIFVANTETTSLQVVDVLRKAMVALGLKPDHYSQGSDARLTTPPAKLKP